MFQFYRSCASCRQIVLLALAAWAWSAGAAPHPSGQLVSWGRLFIPEISADARFKAVATGAAHTVVLKEDGTVTGWGANSSKQLDVPQGLSNVVSIAAGGYDTIALRADGTVAGWGASRTRFATMFPTWTQVKSISMSHLRAMALREDGTILEWAGTSPGSSPVPKPDNLTNIVAVAAGGRHSLALFADGHAVGWGYNFTGQAIVPANITNIVAIAAGETYSMVMRDDRTVYGWGTIDFVVTNVVYMAAGPSDASLLQGDGMLLQMGSSGRKTSKLDLAAVKQIAGGDGFYMVLYNDGRLTGAGLNDDFQASTPEDFAGFAQVSAFGQNDISASKNLAVLRANGTVLNWSDSPLGNIVAPAGLSNVTDIAAGDIFSLALRNDGSVVGWGSSELNRLAIPGDLTNATAIATHGAHSLALRKDGTVAAWGYSISGQISVPSGLTNVVAIAAGIGHSMALKSDGSVVCWGENSYKQCLVPPNLTNAIAIAAGDYHSMALRNDGTVVVWGDKRYGQTNTPAQLSRVVAIIGGSTHSAAILDDGSIVAWGSTNTIGFPPVAGSRGFLSIASAYGQTMAVVQSQPRLEGGVADDRFDIKFWGFAGKRYRLEYTSSLPGENWLETAANALEGKWGWNVIPDANRSLTEARFYRLREEPSE